MASRVAPMTAEPTVRQRRPKVEASAHLGNIRALPCLICLARPPSEAAHIRTGSRKHGKRETGVGERPSDIFVLPLCPRCHRIGPAAQHTMNEMEFYQRHRIDPFATALALWAASGNADVMELIVAEARRIPDRYEFGSDEVKS